MNFLDSQLVVHLALVLAKTLEGTSSVVVKVVLNESSGIPVLMTQLYMNLFSSITLLLAAYLTEKNKLPLRRKSVQLRMVASGSASFLAQLSAFYALKFTSPELVTVISCTIPVMASVIAIVFRVENVQLTRYDGQAKIFGIVIASCGTLIMSMYQGSKLLGTGISQWRLGCLLSTLSALCVASGVNIQAPVLKSYHAPWSVSAMIVVTNTALTAVACLSLVKPWPLPTLEVILGLVYCGVVGIAVAYALIAWVISKAGVLLVCCYIAVSPISATILSLIFLGSELYMGSVLGAVLVICGVIICGWSESETKKMTLATLHEPLVV